VIGADAMVEASDGTMIDRTLVQHIFKLRDVPFFHDAVLFIGIETNFGGRPYASKMAALFQPNPNDDAQIAYHNSITKGRSLGRIFIYNKDLKGTSDPGVWTGPEQKIAGATALQESLRRGNFRFASEFFTTDKNGPEKMKAKIIDQFKHFRKEAKEITNPAFQKPGYTLTGKTTTRKDDLVVCVQLNMYWEAYLCKHPLYLNACKVLGLKTYS
jgi:hypothetical protein